MENQNLENVTAEVNLGSFIEDVKQMSYEKGKIDGKIEAEREIKRSPVISVNSQKPTNLLGYALRAITKSRIEGKTVHQVVDEWERHGHRPEADVIKAMVPSDPSAGGFYLSKVLSDEIIPALREAAVIRKAGASTTALIGGQLIMRTEGSGSAAYWTGEGALLTESNITGTQVQISSKRLGTFVVINNKLLEYANPVLEAEVVRDLTYAIAAKEDQTYLRGAVSQVAPTGILNAVDSSMKFDATANPTVADVVKDLGKAFLKLRTSLIPMYKPVIIISPRTEYFLKTLRDNGGFVFRDEMNTGKIYGYPYYVTTFIPENLGTGNNETEIYVGDAAQCVIGEDGSIDVKVVPNGVYHNAQGNAISGLLTGETVVAAEMHVAFAIKYAKAFSVIQKVTWGA